LTMRAFLKQRNYSKRKTKKQVFL